MRCGVLAVGLTSLMLFAAPNGWTEHSEIPVLDRRIKPESARNLKLEGQIRDWMGSGRTQENVYYNYGDVDLDGDGVPETVAYLFGRDLCGSGGCITLVLKKARTDYEVIADISLTWTPIMVADSGSHGWKDLIVFVHGGGILPGYYARLAFNGKTYPRNPTAAPAIPIRRPTRVSAYLVGGEVGGFQLPN